MNNKVALIQTKKRDRIVEKLTTDSGTLHRYRSGRIIHIDKDGNRTDVLSDLDARVNGPRTWKCFRLNGGGTVVYDSVNKSEAMARCGRELGAVIYTDDLHNFIFYRDNAAQGSHAPMSR